MGRIAPTDPAKSAAAYTKAIAVHEKYAEAAAMKAKGLTWRQIGTALGCNPETARQWVRKALAAIPSEAAWEWRRIETDRLENVLSGLMDIWQTTHPTVSNGKLFENVEDVAPRLQAARLIQTYSESLRKLHGVDEPTRTKVEVVSDELISKQIAELTSVLKERGESVPELSDLDVEDAFVIDDDEPPALESGPQD